MLDTNFLSRRHHPRRRSLSKQSLGRPAGGRDQLPRKRDRPRAMTDSEQRQHLLLSIEHSKQSSPIDTEERGGEGKS